MRKILTVALMLMLSVTLSACGKSAQVAKTDNAAKTESTQETQDLFSIMESGNYYMKYTMEAKQGSTTYNTTNETAIDGKNVAIVTEMEYEGKPVKTRMLKIGTDTYTIDDNTKTIAKTPIDISSSMNKALKMNDVTKEGSGTAEINGKSLPYTEYKTADGYTAKFFTENSKTVAIESKGEGITAIMNIEKYSKTAPAGMFELPKGYTESAY